MPEFFSIKHSFKSGDLISVLPGLQHIYQQKGKKWKIMQRLNMPEFLDQKSGQYIIDDHPCMNTRMFDLLKPLLESQEYIESFEKWTGQQVDIDIDLSREMAAIPMPSGIMHMWPWMVAPEFSCDLSIPWIKVNPLGYCNTTKGIKKLSDYMIFSRTERYINPYISYFFLKEYEDRIIFSGSIEEHKRACESWGIDLPLIITDDFLELARAIGSCKVYLGNASLGWHLADSQKVTRIIELSRVIPCTFPTGADGYGFYSQSVLEFHVKNLMR